MTNMTLPTDSATRKDIPVYGGFLMYFPAAVAGAARHSKRGNDKHNPGKPLHHARGKSTDHEECIGRHLIDMGDLEAAIKRLEIPCTKDEDERKEMVRLLLEEADALVWRTAALSQELYEIYGGAPLAPGAVVPPEPIEFSVGNADALPKFRVGARVRSIRNNETGEVRKYREDFTWDDNQPYMWLEGNFSCDCNRRRKFAFAIGEDAGWEIACGDTAFTVLRAELPDGTVIKLEEK